MLTKSELELIAKLLDLAADEFSNHRCNSFALANTPENREIAGMAETFVLGDSAYPLFLSLSPVSEIDTDDSVLMKYLSERVRQEAKAQGGR